MFAARLGVSGRDVPAPTRHQIKLPPLSEASFTDAGAVQQGQQAEHSSALAGLGELGQHDRGLGWAQPARALNGPMGDQVTE
ncbi:hypothetical protein D3C78_1430130 [compost metagenome]